MVQGHRNPWGKLLADYTIAELDFVLEMAARDEPERWTFVRGGTTARTESMARWNDVLGGPMLLRYMARTGIAVGIANVAAFRRRKEGGMRPGLTRRGVPLSVDNVSITAGAPNAGHQD